MKTQELLITPEIARNFLETNVNNRPIKTVYIDYLSNLMNNGLWQEGTGEAIKINKNGCLIDGQHRLNALIKSNKELKMLVVYEVENIAIEVIDQGIKRTIHDVFSLAHIPDGTKFGSIIHLSELIKTNRYYIGGRSTSLSPREYLFIYNNDADSLKESLKVGRWCYYKSKGVIPIIHASTIHYLLKDNHRKEIEHFLNKITTGMDMDSLKDPAYILRMRYLLEYRNVKRTKPSHMVAFLIKAWNFNYKKLTCSLLKMNPDEEWPKLLK